MSIMLYSLCFILLLITYPSRCDKCTTCAGVEVSTGIGVPNGDVTNIGLTGSAGISASVISSGFGDNGLGMGFRVWSISYLYGEEEKEEKNTMNN